MYYSSDRLTFNTAPTKLAIALDGKDLMLNQSSSMSDRTDAVHFLIGEILPKISYYFIR
jgi:hypothetical protein